MSKFTQAALAAAVSMFSLAPQAQAATGWQTVVAGKTETIEIDKSRIARVWRGGRCSWPILLRVPEYVTATSVIATAASRRSSL